MMRPDPSTAAELGRRGRALVALADQEGDRGWLDEGLAELERAALADPKHPDRITWWYALGAGYERRADEYGSIDDCARAISWYTRLRGELTAGDPDRDAVTIALASTHWSRYSLLRHGQPDGADPREPLRDLVDALVRLAAGDPEAPVAAYLRMVLGLAALERYEITDSRADLDRGLAALAAAVPVLPDDAPWIAVGAYRLAAAHREVATADEDVKALDLSIVAGARAVELSEAGRPTWVSAHESQALCYGARWDLSGDRDDLDRAIDAWHQVLIHEDDGWAAEWCGQLLRERGTAAGDRDDLREAIRLLERSLRGAPDDGTAAKRWIALGEAHYARWKVGAEPGSLETAEGCVDRALRGELSDLSLISAYVTKLNILHDIVVRDDRRPHDTVLDSAVRYRTLLGQALAALDRAVGADPDLRAMLGGLIGFGEMWICAYDLRWFDVTRVRGLLALAARVRSAGPGWTALMEVASGMYEYATQQMRGQVPGDRGVARMTEALRSGALEDCQDEISRILAMVVHARGTSRGDLREIAHISQQLEHDPAGVLDDRSAEDVVVLATLMEALQRGASGDLESVAALVDEAGWRFAELPVTVQSAGFVGPVLEMMRQLIAAARGERLPADDTPLEEPPEPGWAGGMRLVAAMMGPLGQLTRASGQGDVAALREVAERLDGYDPLVPAGHPLRMLVVYPAAMANLNIAGCDRRDRGAVERALRYYTEACRLARGPEHPMWPTLALGKALAGRLAGDEQRAPSRELGLSALASHAQRVMLQAGAEYAVEAARAAAKDAAAVASWALADGAHDDLVAALDAGRGLVLHAATASREVADQLAARGHDDLAGEWRATGGQGRDPLDGRVLTGDAGGVPDDLRARVLHALGASGMGGLGEPMRVAQIASALAGVGADALAYLVPEAFGMPGVVVVVPASGPVRVLLRPWLKTGPGTPLDGYLRKGGPGSGTEWLDELCTWAWQAATGALVHLASRWRLGRPAHLVLVPMGALALVPWHAAARGQGRGRRYAVRDVMFSYSPSARMLAVAARHEVRPIRSALVVGDPGGDLAFAGVEARAVHRAFYPEGRYLGRLAGEPGAGGTPRQMFDWIADASGPSMIHLACHGRVDPRRPTEAHLELAGGARLTAGELIEASRVAELVIDQVFLAACTTSRSGEDYDEAFSLASAFLAAGAHTVFGSLWPVPDADTSALMYMLHHFLRVESRPPAQALHAAQLWMLDPGRRPPAAMPDELVRCHRHESLAHPASWAGFTHMGR